MEDHHFEKLMEDVEAEFLNNPNVTLGILGLTPITLRLAESLSRKGMSASISGIFVDDSRHGQPAGLPVPVFRFRELGVIKPQVLIIASDIDKEVIILSALPFITGTPKLIISGYAHFGFNEKIFEEELAHLLIPSFANGYPNTLVHIYQCLTNAARLGLRGCVVEFGMFKGGTTMFMARLIRRLKSEWKIIGFDSFAGFPPRRSPLDMYDHPGCIFTDLPAVRRQFVEENVEIVPGDIVETAKRVAFEDLVFVFLDTDNFSPAAAALDIITDRVVVGGAILFDHFTGTNKFRYTLGERLAGKRLLDDPRYFNLHGTGVFLKQR